jgi:hypothetical protein
MEEALFLKHNNNHPKDETLLLAKNEGLTKICFEEAIFVRGFFTI